MRTIAGILVVLVAACGESKEDKQKECDRIQADIESAADDRNIPRQGACNSAAARADENFQAACKRLDKCLNELDDM